MGPRLIPEELERKTLRSTASEVVSRLIAREPPTPNVAVVAARVVLRICADLARFIGSDGCHALLVRALTNAKRTHPALHNISILAQPDLSVHGVPESIEAHGASDTAAGLETTVAEVIHLLGRLVGDELAMKLVDQNSSDRGLPETAGDRNGE